MTFVEYGSVTFCCIGSAPIRRDSSISVMSSPNIFAMLPRLISSTISTNRLSPIPFCARHISNLLEDAVVQPVPDLPAQPHRSISGLYTFDEILIREVLVEGDRRDCDLSPELALNRRSWNLSISPSPRFRTFTPSMIANA